MTSLNPVTPIAGYLPPFLMMQHDDSPPTFEPTTYLTAQHPNAVAFWTTPSELYDPYVKRCRQTLTNPMNVEDFACSFFASAEKDLRGFEKEHAMSKRALAATDADTMRDYAIKVLHETRRTQAVSGAARAFTTKPPKNFPLDKALALIDADVVVPGDGEARQYYDLSEFEATSAPQLELNLTPPTPYAPEVAPVAPAPPAPVVEAKAKPHKAAATTAVDAVLQGAQEGLFK